MSQPAEDNVREVRPFSLGFDKEIDADFAPRVVKADTDVEDEADPKGSSVPGPVDFSDLVPEMDVEPSVELVETATPTETKPVAKATMPPKVPSPGK